jgi:hypothetical protein
MEAISGAKVYKNLHLFLPIDGIVYLIMEYMEKNLWEYKNQFDIPSDIDKSYDSWDEFINDDSNDCDKNDIIQFQWNRYRGHFGKFKPSFISQKIESKTELDDEKEEEDEEEEEENDNDQDDDGGKKKDRTRNVSGSQGEMIFDFEGNISQSVQVVDSDHDPVFNFLKTKMKRFVRLLDVVNF